MPAFDVLSDEFDESDLCSAERPSRVFPDFRLEVFVGEVLEGVEVCQLIRIEIFLVVEICQLGGKTSEGRQSESLEETSTQHFEGYLRILISALD